MNVYVLMYTECYDDTFADAVYDSEDEALRVCNERNATIKKKRCGTGYSVQECQFFKTEPPTPVASA